MFKLIVAGTRSFSDYNLLEKILDKLLIDKIDKNKFFLGIEIVSGKASGADILGERYASKRRYAIKEFPADWKNLNVEKCVVKENKYGKYNALAGNNRNQQMADYADACVVFWDGKSTGTKDMIGLAKKKNIPLRIIKY